MQKRRFPVNCSFAITFLTRPVNQTAVTISKRLLLLGAVALAATGPSFAQDNALQEKVAAVKQSMAENKQRLSQYQWIETTNLTLKGDSKPSSQSLWT
jgi:hypothetical protein